MPVWAGRGRLALPSNRCAESSVGARLAFDYALVCLDLALLLLGQGDTGEVRALAEEMLTIFRSQQVEREPLAALQFFCEAAKREAASVELARRVVKYLNRAQYDPELRFDEDQGAKAS